MHGFSKRLRLAAAAVGLAAGGMVAAGVAPASAGVGGPAFYVDGQLYRTVGTPTDLSGTSAPANTWDVIYEFFGAQLNVAEAAPGDPDYNGGRWQVHGLAFPQGYAGERRITSTSVARLNGLPSDVRSSISNPFGRV